MSIIASNPVWSHLGTFDWQWYGRKCLQMADPTAVQGCWHALERGWFRPSGMSLQSPLALCKHLLASACDAEGVAVVSDVLRACGEVPKKETV